MTHTLLEIQYIEEQHTTEIDIMRYRWKIKVLLSFKSNKLEVIVLYKRVITTY